MNAARLLFCVYNLLFLIIGGVLLGIGIWISTDDTFTGKLKDLLHSIQNVEGKDTLINLVSQGGYVLIGFGALIFLLSFLGYCGAVKESRFLLGFYTFLLGIIFILEIIAVVLALTLFAPQLEDKTQKILVQSIDDNYRTREDGIRQDGFPGILNGIMTDFKCCGIHGGGDFAVYHKETSKLVPPACCFNVHDLNCQINPTDSNSYNSTGCYPKLREDLLSAGWKTAVIVVGVVIGLLQLLGIIFAIFTYKKAYYN